MTPADRFHHEDAGQDQRGAFQRDRDRILYSSAFRRLAGVTQVVSASEGHVFHNRLTHSIKVAQVGRRVAEMLRDRDEKRSDELAIHPEVVEGAALAHDLGHPPFGHVGEKALNECMAEFGKNTAGASEGFEGNPQSFRIVTHLAMRREGLTGLNLTRATLNAMLKYPWARAASGRASEKWGAYESEKDYLEWARKDHSRGVRSAGAFLMDWADDVTYSVHDVEDFYRAGLVPLDRLAVDDGERARFLKKLRETDAGESDALEKILGLLQSPVLRPFDGTAGQRGALRFFVSTLVGQLVRSVDFDADSEVGLALNPDREIWVRVLKGLMRYYVFANPALAAQQHGYEQVLRETFEILFTIGMEPDSSGPPRGRHVLPASVRHLFDEADGKDRVARLVADALAGMTERQALDLHGRLTGRRPGSVLNRIVR